MITRDRIEDFKHMSDNGCFESATHQEFKELCDLALIGLQYKGVFDAAQAKLDAFVNALPVPFNPPKAVGIGEAIFVPHYEPIADPTPGPQFGFESKQFDKGIK